MKKPRIGIARYFVSSFLVFSLLIAPLVQAAVPISEAGAAQQVNEGDTVTLDGSGSAASGTGEDITYSWVVDPAVTLTGANTVEASFVAPAVATDTVYKATLTVTDSTTVPNTHSDYVQITVKDVPVNQPPVADFTSVPNDENPLKIDFTDASTDGDGTVASYAWDFGEAGNTSTEQNPNHTYASAGTYTVTLTVTDDDSAASTVKSKDVTVSGPANLIPVADFSFETDDGNPLKIDFTDASSDDDGTVASYAWDFGEPGSASTAENPSHTYAAAGNYTVKLTVTDNDGGVSLFKGKAVSVVADKKPTANADNVTTNHNTRVIIPVLDNDTLGDGTKAQHSVTVTQPLVAGQGVASVDGINAVFTPTDGFMGTATFTYTMKDIDGDTASASIAVTVNPPDNLVPTAAFTSTPDAADPQKIIFKNASEDTDGTIASYAWTFGEAGSDSNTSTLKDPEHTYETEGTYTVTLTVTDDDGAESEPASEEITVTKRNSPPVADAGGDDQGQILVIGDEVQNGTVQTITLDGSKSTDPDGNDFAFLWEQIPLEGDTEIQRAVVLTNADLAEAFFPAIAVNEGKLQLKFKLTVTDPQGATATDNVLVIISQVGNPVLAFAGENQVVLEGASVTLSGRGVLREEEQEGLVWKQLSGPEVDLDDSDPTKVVFVTPIVPKDTSAHLVFELTVTADLGLSDSDTVDVFVDDNAIGAKIPDGYLSFLSRSEDEQPVGIRVNGGGLVYLAAVAATNTTSQPRRTPIGLIDIKVKTATPGATPQIEVYLTEAAPEGYVWFRNDDDNGWREFPQDNFSFNADRTVVTFTISDAGALDDDQTADSLITTRVGLGPQSRVIVGKATSGGGVIGMGFFAIFAWLMAVRKGLVSVKYFASGLRIMRTLITVILLGWVTTGHAWQTEYFIGGSFGSVSLEKDASEVERELESDIWPGATVDVDDNANIFKLYGGAFFTPAMGIRVSYINLGQADIGVSANVPLNENGQFASDALNALPNAGQGAAVSLLGRFNLGSNLVIHDWLGVFLWQNELSVELNGETFDASETGVDYVFGIGLEYIFHNGLGLRLEAERYNQDSDAIDMLGLGASYYF